jgi:hypothetical protein
MDGIGSGLADAFIGLALIGLLVGGIIVGGAWWFFSSDEIKSDKLLKPEIQLVIEDNKVDTIYVYKK